MTRNGPAAKLGIRKLQTAALIAEPPSILMKDGLDPEDENENSTHPGPASKTPHLIAASASATLPHEPTANGPPWPWPLLPAAPSPLTPRFCQGVSLENCLQKDFPQDSFLECSGSDLTL
jgi:hypothetical protein